MEEAVGATIDDLPEELRQIVELKRQQRDARIEALSKVVAKSRDEAVSARQASGIERIWDEDEEYYLGIDDANRHNHAYTKGMNPDSGITSNTREETAGRCTAFFNITRQFVDSASARMGDILLPAGDWNFALKPTPMPEMDEIKGSAQPVVSQAGVATNPDGSPYTLGQFQQEETADAGRKVSKAELQIRDWLTECRYHAEVRKVIEDAAKIGTGILRGAYPKKQKTRAMIGGKLVMQDKIIPSSKRIDPRNFFPAPNCGDDIQRGSYVLERDYLSARELRDLKGVTGYIDKNIDKVLEEGPGKCNEAREGNKAAAAVQEDKRFEVWYYFGDVNIDDLDALGAKKEGDEPGPDMVPAVVVLINDTVIRGFVNPLDTGEFPYDVMPWQRMADVPWGVGVSRQGRTAQEMLNASARALMDNMGVSAGIQFIIKRGVVVPADGDYRITRNKVWYVNEEADVRAAQDALTAIEIPSVQAELTNIIQLAYKMMEDATGISFLLQGQQGSAPDTVGGMELLHKNSSSLLRRIARTFDENITEPHIIRYYDWLLLHGDDEMKGDFKIEALGSSALVEREIQAMQAQQILQLALNPAFGYSPKKAADELLRAWRFQPSKFEMDDDEKQAQQQQQPAPPPAVQAAQIRAASAEKIAAARAQAETEKMRMDMDRDTVYAQSMAERDRMTFDQRAAELQLRKELALLDYANKHQLKLEDVKKDLATTAMKLRTTKELAAAQLSANKLPINPPVEPPGRARPGHSFTE